MVGFDVGAVSFLFCRLQANYWAGKSHEEKDEFYYLGVCYLVQAEL